MPITFQEIGSRALAFSREWKHAESEDADAKSFWDAFFHLFGFIAGYRKHVLREQDPFNVHAVQKMGELATLKVQECERRR